MDVICRAVSTVIACLLLQFTLSAYVYARYVHPDDCTWEPIPNTSGVSMTCSIATLQGGPSSTNFSLIMPGHTIQLAVICDDVMLQSELGNSSFEHLRGLQTLSLEYCKLNRVPPRAFYGLSDLKRLVVKTHNVDSSHFVLRVSPMSFAPLESIESIDLSRNNIESLPHATLCGLAHLRFVNLSRNAFTNVLNTGFSSQSRCNPAIRELKVDHNKLKSLSDHAFASLVRLEELRLEHNHIARAEPFALTGLLTLERLDISHNMLVALPAKLFQPTTKLSELYLRNNSIGALPPGLFSGVREIAVLDLAHNELSTLEWLRPESSADLVGLSVLDLSHNKLTRLDQSDFHALINLQTLQLQHNLIDHIANKTFVRLVNLQTLVLSNNRLKNIDANMMAGLHTIMTLQLDNNRLDGVHIHAFKNISMLQELNLAGNRLTTVPHAVSSLKMLRSLDLSENNIHHIANASYRGLNQLYALNLMGNRIGNISQGVLKELPSVRILNLARNGIQVIEQSTFDDVPGLHYLRLDSNAIDDVSGLFSNLHDLIMLNISVNRVRGFDYALIPVGLQWLDIHGNQIDALGNYFELEQSLKLRTLDASFNRLTELEPSSLPSGIEIIFLKNNDLKFIQPFTFLGKQNLTRVDLTNNKLRVLEISTFRLSEVPARRPLPEFSIGGNPYLCNCHMEWLQRLHGPIAISSDESRQYPRVIDLHRFECQLSFSKNAQILPLVKVKPSQFLCEYKSHCFSLCHCCDFDACDCEMVCPDNCTCYHDQSWNTNIVDCSAQHHRVGASPQRLPMEVSEVYLDGNIIPTLTPHSFMGRNSMKVLFLNNSKVVTIQNSTFSGLQNLRVLRLENNNIFALHGHEFDGLHQLSELYLSNNQLNYVSNTTFAHVKNLKILHLDRNYLVDISVWSFQYNSRLVELRLSQNPWTCDCRFTKEFSQFLQGSGAIVRDIFQVLCVYNETRALPLWELNVTGCHTNPALISRFHLQSIENYLPMFAVLSGAFFVALLLIVVVFTYHYQMSLWMFSRYGIRIFQRAPVEEEKLFDAFVSYSKRDEAFVAQILAPELECGSPPYRLCLHYRDLPMAGGYLNDAIQEAVESSRRTIVILSEHFLKSEWCRYEFKSAHQEVLNNKHHKLVVVFVGRVSYRELDPDIRHWLKHSTFLHWGEKTFWNKLRFSMPDTRHRKVMRSDLSSVAVHI
ncbi:slit3 protein-like [Tropilaelaps mercedesae]|uniref:Slit3 protein-like n=1 Tax=Tropilaelaps mercedesae TaxID=418985 RepID=A0A1V9XAN7_9ACAR|nr:slit3 protein-like [Tropilaelaps mercedesae]